MVQSGPVLRRCLAEPRAGCHIWDKRGCEVTKLSTYQRVISILVIMHLIGCTTMKPIEPSSHTTEKAEIYVERLKEGDHIVIYPTSGEPIRMEVVAVTDADIRGNTSTDLEITIRTEDIARIERKEFAAGDTAAAAVGWSIGSVLLFFTIIGPLLFVLTY